jgi:hypothetical protein
MNDGHNAKAAKTPANHDRLERRLDKMVDAGRVSADDAERVRTAASSDEREAAVTAIRTQHVRARIDEAVVDGRLSEEQAAGLRQLLDGGQDPQQIPGLRQALRHRASKDSSNARSAGMKHA